MKEMVVRDEKDCDGQIGEGNAPVAGAVARVR